MIGTTNTRIIRKPHGHQKTEFYPSTLHAMVQALNEGGPTLSKKYHPTECPVAVEVTTLL